MKKKTTPQAQLWTLLKSDEQKAFVAENFRPLKKTLQRDFSYALIAYIKWNAIRPFNTRWKQNFFDGLLLFFEAEFEMGNMN